MSNPTPSPTLPGRKKRATKAEMQARRAAEKLAPVARNTLLPALLQERHKVYEQRLKAQRAGVALDIPARVCNSTSTQPLDPMRHAASQVMRPGADDHRKYKSLGF